MDRPSLRRRTLSMLSRTLRLLHIADVLQIHQTSTMGVFSRKKDKVAEDDASITKKTKKGKKVQQEEVQPVFDLGSALPSTNDFRTSLIMPGLSTRFSMLREQDDRAPRSVKRATTAFLRRNARLGSTNSASPPAGFLTLPKCRPLVVPFDHPSPKNAQAHSTATEPETSRAVA